MPCRREQRVRTGQCPILISDRRPLIGKCLEMKLMQTASNMKKRIRLWKLQQVWLLIPQLHSESSLLNFGFIEDELDSPAGLWSASTESFYESCLLNRHARLSTLCLVVCGCSSIFGLKTLRFSVSIDAFFDLCGNVCVFSKVLICRFAQEFCLLGLTAAVMLTSDARVPETKTDGDAQLQDQKPLLNENMFIVLFRKIRSLALATAHLPKPPKVCKSLKLVVGSAPLSWSQWMALFMTSSRQFYDNLIMSCWFCPTWQQTR